MQTTVIMPPVSRVIYTVPPPAPPAFFINTRDAPGPPTRPLPRPPTRPRPRPRPTGVSTPVILQPATLLKPATIWRPVMPVVNVVQLPPAPDMLLLRRVT